MRRSIVVAVGVFLLSLVGGAFLTGESAGLTYAQGLQPCGAVSRLYETAVPRPPTATPAQPTLTPTAAPPTATPRPAPTEDRVGFPKDYQTTFKLMFVFDRPDNRQVRVICGNDVAMTAKKGEPFPYGSILVMETWRAKQDAQGNPIRDEKGHYIREALTGVFVQRKEKGFGEAYLADRSGEWEYTAYRANGNVLTAPQNSNACSSCHLRQAGESVDYLFRMNLYFEGDAALKAPASDPNNVSIFLYTFIPHELKVKVGTTVTWVNNDEAEHTIKAADESFSTAASLKTIHIKPGDSFSVTFDKAGTYEFSCTIHRGMRAKIIVE
jgi:plastocyanin